MPNGELAARTGVGALFGGPVGAGVALLSGLGSVLSRRGQARASRNAAQREAAARLQAIQQAQGIYQTAQQGALGRIETGRTEAAGITQPYATAGTEALGGLTGLQLPELPTPGQYLRPTTPSPYYQLQLELGQQAINRELAARGLYGSGAGLAQQERFTRQLGAEETERQFGRGVTEYGLALQRAQIPFQQQLGLYETILGRTSPFALAQQQAELQAAQYGAETELAGGRFGAELALQQGGVLGAQRAAGPQARAQLYGGLAGELAQIPTTLALYQALGRQRGS